MEHMANSNKIVKIQGVFKHYAWGGKTFFPRLFNLSNPEGKPYAEYWLGSGLHAEAGELPYLFKVLDVEKMLSIQVHPSKKKAELKFEEENRKGIPLDAPNRNYKDRNHKPELFSPLSEFFLLHGFKPEEKMKEILGRVAELNFLEEDFGKGDYRRLYARVMRMPQPEVNERLAGLLERIIPRYQQGTLIKMGEDYWAARAALTFNHGQDIDRGIFSIYLFNLVRMLPGEALFQDAGLPHAYLEGQTMEIMANSDNVLRGGLTPKHIDVEELLDLVAYEPTVPRVIRGSLAGEGEELFRTPAHDFQLSRISAGEKEQLSFLARNSDIYFVYAGETAAVGGEAEMRLRAGEALLVLPGTTVLFIPSAALTMFRATVPSVE